MDNFKAQAIRWRRRYAVTIRRTAGVLLAVLSLWFAGWLSVGDRIMIVRWGAFIAPWLGLLTLAVAAAFVLGYRRWWALAAAALALIILMPVLPRLNPARWFANPAAADLTVMTFNTSLLNHDYRAIARLIADEHPDIVFLQQLGDLEALKSELERLPKRVKYQNFPEQRADTIILSRYPLSPGPTFHDRTAAAVTIGHCRIGLWDLHAPHGHFANDAQRAFFAWAAADLHRDSSPILLGGDLNSTEFNSVQAPLRAELHDVFADVGKGFGFTFPSEVRRFGLFGRIFRIDHIFYRPAADLSPLWASVKGNANSDHFAVTAGFRLAARCLSA